MDKATTSGSKILPEGLVSKAPALGAEIPSAHVDNTLKKDEANNPISVDPGNVQLTVSSKTQSGGGINKLELLKRFIPKEFHSIIDMVGEVNSFLKKLGKMSTNVAYKKLADELDVVDSIPSNVRDTFGIMYNYDFRKNPLVALVKLILMERIGTTLIVTVIVTMLTLIWSVNATCGMLGIEYATSVYNKSNSITNERNVMKLVGAFVVVYILTVVYLALLYMSLLCVGWLYVKVVNGFIQGVIDKFGNGAISRFEEGKPAATSVGSFSVAPLKVIFALKEVFSFNHDWSKTPSKIEFRLWTLSKKNKLRILLRIAKVVGIIILISSIVTGLYISIVTTSNTEENNNHVQIYTAMETFKGACCISSVIVLLWYVVLQMR
jgi:hypothetical protein